MNTAAQLFKVFLRIGGGAALLLGLAFWLGYGRSLTRLHMDLGVAVVISLWVLAGIAWWGGARITIVAFAVGWGALTWVVGVMQWRLLPGSFHWIVRVVHLLLGVVCNCCRHQAGRSQTGGQSAVESGGLTAVRYRKIAAAGQCAGRKGFG